MPESREQSPGDDYFNDLSQQLPSNKQTAEENGTAQDENGQVPKPKRIACVLCRKRKLKCDGTKPSCGTCTRLQHDCSYDEVRRKSGPKRGYVKALEARLAQVETLLKTQDDQPANGTNHTKSPPQQQTNGHVNGNGMSPEFENIGLGRSNINPLQHLQTSRAQYDYPAQSPHPHSALGGAVNGEVNGTSEEPFPWEMIGLGLDEPLPNQEVVNELNQIFFDKVHPSLPMIHRPRYFAAMNLAPHMRPPVALRYAMWCNAAAVSDKYESLQEHFYHRSRKYAQQDEMKGHGESMITVAHAQTWALIATFEFRHMYFPRAWMSSGRGSRLAQMMGLHRLDGSGLDVKQCLPPPKDWTEREERRRTFWMCFCVDRYASIGTGWPMTIEEKDILTALPADEENFELSRPAKTINLPDALEPSGPPNLSSFAGVILMACLFGRNLTHLHRPSPDDHDDDLNGDFWKRHRAMDNILLNTALALPDHLRLPSGLNNPNIVFCNMNIHTSTICLHQAAIFKADKNRMPARISAESKVRCITAAAEIASIMRQVSHLDLSAMNPFISFCLYVAARVFVQYLKSRPKDVQVKASLQFLLSAMHAIKRRNPLTESFLVQLDVDLEGAGLEDSHVLRAQMQQAKSTQPNRSPGCPYDANVHIQNMDSSSGLAYGDPGLAAYNKPSSSGIVDRHTRVDPSQATFGYSNQYELPSRQRTPGSTTQNQYQTPNSVIIEMDISPDGSNNDHQTPGSSSHHQAASSHTSNTGLSPQNSDYPPGQPQPPGRLHGLLNDPIESPSPQEPDTSATTNATPQFASTMFDPSDPSIFTTDFNMHSFPASIMDDQQPGFIMPQTSWNGASSNSGSGMTPGSSTNEGASNTTNGHQHQNPHQHQQQQQHQHQHQQQQQQQHQHQHPHQHQHMNENGATSMISGFGGGNNGLADMMTGMTDADWNSVLGSFTGWESGVDNHGQVQDMMLGRR